MSHTLSRLPKLPLRKSVVAMVPIGAVDDAARTAVTTALSMSGSRVTALHVCENPVADSAFIDEWERWEPGVPLVLLQRLPSADPIAGSIADYLNCRHFGHLMAVVLPSSDSRERNDAIEAALLALPDVVVCRSQS